MVEAFKEVCTELKKRKLKPSLHKMDNECCKAVQTYIEEEYAHIQLVEPYIHRVNAAEQAIQTFKNHFISGLCTVDSYFPIQLWDKLLPQA